MKFTNRLYIILAFLLSPNLLKAQNKTIDEVVAVIGNHNIKLSDIIATKKQMVDQGEDPNKISECDLLEQLMFQKLLVYQSQVDSVDVTEKQVEQELEKRIRFFSEQLGGEQKLEEFYGKSISEIKEEFKEKIKEQLLAQTMQGKITGGTTVSPAEVRTYYNSIPDDSLPFINAEVEVARLLKMPSVSEEEKILTREKLEKLRERIVAGTDFASMAALYSEDPGSAAKGGELGFMGRGMLVPEFERVGFNLQAGEVSKIVETPFGFHIIQLIERRGDSYNLRHILLAPKINPAQLYKAQQDLDSIFTVLQNDTVKWDDMVLKYSDDKESKNNGGLLVNPNTGTTRFEVTELDQQLFLTIDQLKVGQFSKPVLYQMPDGKRAYQILYLKTRTEAHKANLKDDYQRIQNVTVSQKQAKVVSDWVKKKKKSTYVQIDEQYKNCSFKNAWF